MGVKLRMRNEALTSEETAPVECRMEGLCSVAGLYDEYRGTKSYILTNVKINLVIGVVVTDRLNIKWIIPFHSS